MILLGSSRAVSRNGDQWSLVPSLVDAAKRKFPRVVGQAAAARGGEVEIVASRWLGGAWTQDRCGSGWVSARRSGGRRLDVEVTERVVFALVAQHALEPA